MGVMLFTKTLRGEPKPDGTELGNAGIDQPVETFQIEADFIRVKLVAVDGTPEGWVPKSAVGQGSALPKAIDKETFAFACWSESLIYGVNAHYLAAVAELRSGTANDSDASGKQIGPFRLLAEEWDADWNTQEFHFNKLPATEIRNWRNQCKMFALMTRRAQDALKTAIAEPSAVELYLAQIIGAKAVAGLKKTPSNKIDAILAAVAPDLPLGGLSADQLIERHAKLLRAGGAVATGQQALDQTEAALKPAFASVVEAIRAAGGDVLEGPDDIVTPASAGAAVEANLKTFHGAFDNLPGAQWKLTSEGLLIEGQTRPVGSGGQPTTVGNVWTRWQTEITDAAKEFNVPIELVIATICTESGGNELAERHEPGFTSPEATPHRISVGLMQTLISTARGESSKLGVPANSITRDWLRSGRNSIRAGTSYMARQKAATQFDPPIVACAYNAGSVRRDPSPGNRWKMVQFPIGTSQHADRFVAWFNDCFMLFTPAQLPEPSFVKALRT
jgi:hypothetical protein